MSDEVPTILVDHLDSDCGGNPHLSLIYSALSETYGVRAYGWSSRHKRDWDMLHLNWPEWLVDHTADTTTQRAQVGKLVSEVQRLKRRGTKVIWTAHNHAPHDPGPDGLYVALYNELYPLFDQVQVTSARSIDDFRQRHSELSATDLRVVPLISTRSSYAKTVDLPPSAGEAFAGQPGSRPLLVFGHVRHDRRIPDFLKAASEMELVPLVRIAGQCSDDRLRETIGKAVSRYPQGRASAFLERVEDDAVRQVFQESVMTVIPSPTATNSGVALLSLELGVPTLVPAQPAFLDLQDEYGKEWVKTFEGSLKGGDIATALYGLPAGAPPSEASRRHSPAAVVQALWAAMLDVL